MKIQADKQEYIENLERQVVSLKLQIEMIKKEFSLLQQESNKNKVLRGMEPIKIYQEIEDLERRKSNLVTALRASTNQVKPVLQTATTLLFEDKLELINKLFYLYRFHRERGGVQEETIFCQYQEV